MDTQYKKKPILKRIVIIVTVIIAVSYLAMGRGLQVSNEQSSYRLIGYWVEAGGKVFEEPFAIAVDRRTDNVYLCDAAAHRVIVLDPRGNFIRTFGADRLENPTGIAVAPDGALYVSDYDLDQVFKFNEAGEFLLSWGASGGGDQQFNSPNGIAVDAAGDVYVADFYNKVVKVFNGEGVFKKTIGVPGQWRAGQLDYPTDVAVTADNSILVADAYNHRIQRFTSHGEAESDWGWSVFRIWPSPHQGEKGFSVPVGVEVSRDEKYIHIADSGNRRVVMLDSNGHFITEWKIDESGEGYDTPIGLAVSRDGKKLYVSDIDNKRIIVLGVEN